MCLKDKVIAITGAGKGIGRRIAIEMAREGGKIAVADISKEDGLDTCNIIKENGGISIFTQTDVSHYQDLINFRNKVIARFKKVDILIVNAGISFRRNIKDLKLEEWKKVIDVNLTGSFFTVKAFLNDLLDKNEKQKRKIIFITSGSAFTGSGGGAHYAASKAGQHGLLRALSKELGGKGINVNAIAPRVIETEILNELYPNGAKRNALVDAIPIKRLGRPEDVAYLVCFLASDKASYIHGQTIILDGGRTFQ
ncbi:SDR family NAD(P)-dependent oxidoreductase [Maledivibacter halophilus]|uniref:3-oxoacyl-[acyl-carrier protein] reductase n=1 Tax=Maledivibacter halophilus TaxID=36842 RepID=A0A1T5MI50_9FIRM|nr:SDR family NAD(P)-dependent oxidoreductase [Maledivibacter halophilus]SKC87911.1 3-oxoacyl-[acyl-carrier protein] reductase [Maledivibacter halophilus]